MGKIRLAYFIDSYKPGAGTENQLKGMLQHLDSDRVDAVLFTLRGPILSEHVEEIPWPVECIGVDHLASVGSLFKFFRLVSRLRREMYDIVSVYFDDSNLFVVPACRLAGIKNVVINRRNMGYMYTPGMIKKLRWVNRHATWCLTNSEAVRKRVIAFEKFPAERTKVIHNGIWDKSKPGQDGIACSELGLPESAPVVGIVANLRPVKRIDRFIDMAAKVLNRIPETRFLIIGGGQLENDLRCQAERLGISSRIYFLGQKQNVNQYLPLFDVGVLASESEGLSNTLIEYMRRGVPAVAFDVGGNREVIDDNINGFLVPENDIAQLADKVAHLLLDKSCNSRFAENGIRAVSEKFAPDKIMNQLMSFYRDISRANLRQSDQ